MKFLPECFYLFMTLLEPLLSFSFLCLKCLYQRPVFIVRYLQRLNLLLLLTALYLQLLYLLNQCLILGLLLPHLGFPG